MNDAISVLSHSCREHLFRIDDVRCFHCHFRIGQTEVVDEIRQVPCAVVEDADRILGSLVHFAVDEIEEVVDEQCGVLVGQAQKFIVVRPNETGAAVGMFLRVH